MKKRKLAFVLLTGLVVFAFFVASCEKENSPITNDEVEMAEDEAMAEAILEEVLATVDKVVLDIDLKSTYTDSEEPCRVITKELINDSTLLITIDYGDGCTFVINNDTITKKGMIQITKINRYWQPGSERNTVFVNFYVNDLKIEGERIVKNLGFIDNDPAACKFEVKSNLELIYNGEVVYQREAEKYREWYLGSLFDPGDDVIYITGWVHGINFRGLRFTHTITEPLKKTSCLFIVQGKIEMQVGSNPVITLDFGDGRCDNKATLSRNGESVEITLRFRHRWHRF